MKSFFTKPGIDRPATPVETVLDLDSKYFELHDATYAERKSSASRLLIEVRKINRLAKLIDVYNNKHSDPDRFIETLKSNNNLNEIEFLVAADPGLTKLLTDQLHTVGIIHANLEILVDMYKEDSGDNSDNDIKMFNEKLLKPVNKVSAIELMSLMPEINKYINFD